MYMGVRYDKLFVELEKRGMSKTELREVTNMSTATLAKLSSHRPVTLEILERICRYLELTPNDIFEFDDFDVKKAK